MIRIARGLALMAIAAAAVAALRYAVYLPLVCESAVSRADFTANAASSDAEKLAWARATIGLLQRCRCLDGDNFRLPYTLGNAYSDNGEPKKAVVAYQRALSINRRPEIYVALGLAQLDALDQPGAIDSFVAAGVFDPSHVAEIPYDAVRAEVERRIRSRYGADWVP
jgi:tetratricopeptide (TPR) repeat protein